MSSFYCHCGHTASGYVLAPFCCGEMMRRAYDSTEICACGHHLTNHTHTLRGERKRFRDDCNHCACEEFRERPATTVVDPT